MFKTMEEYKFSKDGVNLSVCAYCLCTLDNNSRTIDHLTPKSRGGKLSNNNKVPACGDCNKLKGNLSVKEFSKALNSLIFFEVENHKKTLGRLKKIKISTDSIIRKLNDK
jgi:5-methylcytosine-specific restriction endonuclease McrA